MNRVAEKLNKATKKSKWIVFRKKDLISWLKIVKELADCQIVMKEIDHRLDFMLPAPRNWDYTIGVLGNKKGMLIAGWNEIPKK